MELVWEIGGPQGTGVDTSANAFAKSLALMGFWVFGKREYHSNIKGAHSYFIVRASDREVRSHSDKIDFLATFDKTTFEIHIDEVKEGGIAIYDPSEVKDGKRNGIFTIPVPYLEIVKTAGEKFGIYDQKKLIIMKNIVAISVSSAILGIPFDYVVETMHDVFKGKRQKVFDLNKYAGKLAYDYGLQFSEIFPEKIHPPEKKTKKVLITGAQSVALGKLMAGCKFQTYYPITPASDESVFLEELSEKGIVVIQTEDEIAAICMAIGSALAGSRSSTSTSGPGFSLMVEALGWAGMNEVPVVVVDWQRGGPSTGLPTRHDQSDLRFAIHGGHGEFPRIVLAPGDIEQCFYIIQNAFNYAERYQLPVIVLCDKSLANSIKTVNYPQLKSNIDRGVLANDKKDNLDDEKDNDNKKDNSEGGYKRFEITPTGISPRAFLGEEGKIFWNTGDEHDEYGHISEDSENRTKMHDKRMRKLKLAEEEIKDKVSIFGEGEIGVISWGSTLGPILDAMERLKEEGIEISFLQVKVLHPFPAKEVEEFIKKKRITISVEMNWSGQLRSLIREKTLLDVSAVILKWNGRPFSVDEIETGIKNILKGSKMEVMRGGK